MKTETSAGGVIVCAVDRTWYVLLLRDMNDTWTFPKGLIELGESPQEAAVREIGEEVGISDLILLRPLSPIRYTYKRNGIVHKTVHYFLFQAKTRIRPIVQKEEGIQEAKWVAIDEAMNIIGYRETNVRLLEETKIRLSSCRT